VPNNNLQKGNNLIVSKTAKEFGTNPNIYIRIEELSAR